MDITTAMKTLIAQADSKILARGKALYAQGCVANLTQTAEGEFEAKVLGSEGDLYEVYITVKDGEPEDYGCDCPYDWGPVCKHLVAVVLAVQAGKYKSAEPEAPKKKTQKQQGISALLQDIDPTDLRYFIAQYAERDQKFDNALRVRFAQPDFDAELKKIKRSVNAVLADVSDWDTHDRWGGVDIDTSEILYEIEQRMEQGHIRLAFAGLEALYVGLLENFEYQGECELSMEAEDCLKRMADIAEQVTEPRDREYIFERCVTLADLEKGRRYGADYADQLLTIASQFVAPENRAQLEEALARHTTGYSVDRFALLHLELIERLDGEAAGRDYVAAHLHIESMCKIALDEALFKRDFTRAEALCLDFIRDREDKGWRSCTGWYNTLLSIYDKTGEAEKQIAIARNLLLEKCDFGYYAVLKKLLKKQGDWEAAYPDVREKCKARLPVSTYMQLLLDEKEAALLLAEVRKQPHTIFTYGAFLAKTYPEEAFTLFWDEIKQLAERASSRTMYHDICGKIKLLADAGGMEDAEALIDLLRQRNARRPAFLDELRQAEGKIRRK